MVRTSAIYAAALLALPAHAEQSLRISGDWKYGLALGHLFLGTDGAPSIELIGCLLHGTSDCADS